MGSIKINAELKQATLLTTTLTEALWILEMPILDLSSWLQEQIENNPALQFDERTGSYSDPNWIDQLPAQPPSLYEHLLAQAREHLSDLTAFEQLLETLDEKGFTDTHSPLLQSFDPPGIGAKNLQHSLLLQLERKGASSTLAYSLIQNHYDDFLHQRSLPYPPEDVAEATALLATLHLNPAAAYSSHTYIPQTPDIFIDTQGAIALNDAYLPSFVVDHAPELKAFLPSARWIEKMLSRRSSILLSIAKAVLAIQNDYIFSHTSELQPLSFKQIAQKLSLSESTISRAVKDKVISCPRGIFPLRFFFPQANQTAKERLKLLIERENKASPLSDEELASALSAQGIPCARRTIAKYRKSLGLSAAHQRKAILIINDL